MTKQIKIIFFTLAPVLVINLGLVGGFLYYKDSKIIPDSLSKSISQQKYFSKDSIKVPDKERNQLLAVLPDDRSLLPLDSRLKLGVVFYRAGDYPGAISELKEVVKNEGDNIAAHYYLALSHYENQDYEEAETHFSSLLSMDAAVDTFEIRGYLGKVGELQKDYQASIFHYEKAHDINPEDEGLTLSLGNAYLAANDKNKALQIYKEVVQSNPDNLIFYLKLADVYLALGDELSYFQTLESLYQRQPLYGGVFILIGEFYREKGFFRKALQYYEDNLKLFDVIPQANYFKGLIYYDMKDYQKAHELFEKTVVLAPHYAPGHYYLGVTYLRLGKLDRAYQEIKIAQSANYEKVSLELIRALEQQLQIYPRTT